MALQRIPLHVRTVLIVAPQFVFTKRLFRNPPVPLMSVMAMQNFALSLLESHAIVPIASQSQWFRWISRGLPVTTLERCIDQVSKQMAVIPDRYNLKVEKAHKHKLEPPQVLSTLSDSSKYTSL